MHVQKAAKWTVPHSSLKVLYSSINHYKWQYRSYLIWSLIKTVQLAHYLLLSMICPNASIYMSKF